MPKNFQALHKPLRLLFLAAALSAAGNFLPAQEPPRGAGETRWYRSNSSGMTLELIPSRLAALRNEYCLSAGGAVYRDLPEILRPYHENSYRIELRILYNEGEEIRRQWIFRGSRNIVRLNASGSGAMFAGARPAGQTNGEEAGSGNSSGFIELRNSDGFVVTEFQFDEDLSEWEYRYFYREQILTRAEVWFKEAPPAGETFPADETSPSEETPPQNTQPVFARVFTDRYRYTRSGSIRAIERTVHGGATEKLRVGFPRIGPGASSGGEIVTPDSAYTSDFFAGTRSIEEDGAISYNLDNRGRVLEEVWKDEDGKILGELTNTWAGDRLQSVLWKSDDEERLVEFEYDNQGNCIVERNYRQGILERTLTNRDGTEIEEIYMNGKVVLRAFWENGIKVSEERVLPGRGSP